MTVDESKNTERRKSRSSSHNNVATNFTFQLNYVGKVAISHRQIPPQLLDDTIDKFRKHWLDNYKNKSRRRAFSARESMRSSTTSLVDVPAEQSNNKKRVRHRSTSSIGPNGEDDGDVDNKWNDDHTYEQEQQERVLESLRPPLIKSVDSLPPSSSKTPHLTTTIAEESSHFKTDNTANVSSDSVDKIHISIGSDNNKIIDEKPFSESNRRMNLYLKHASVILKNCETGSKMLERRMKDISYCCKGEKEDNYFAFVCREAVSGNYQLYVFECVSPTMTSSIMDAFKQGFQALLQLPSNLFCETCPLNYFHRLCLQLEGLSGYLALVTVEKFISTLDDDDRAEVHTKFKDLVPQKSSIRDDQDRVELSMTAVRMVLEAKQKVHTHYTTSQSTTNEAKNLNAIEPENVNVKEPAKLGTFKSLAASFEYLLRGRSRSKGDEAVPKTKTLEVQPEEPRPRSHTIGSPSRYHARDRVRSNVGDEVDTRSNRTSVTSSGDGSKPASPGVLSENIDSMFSQFKDTTIKSKPVHPKPSYQRRVSWRQALFKRVYSNAPIAASIEGNEDESYPNEIEINNIRKPRDRQELRLLWSKAIQHHIAIIRSQKENKYKDDSADKDNRLDYEEIQVCSQEIYQLWNNLMAKESEGPLPYNTLLEAIQAGVPKTLRGEVWNFLRKQYYARDKKQSSCGNDEENILTKLLEKETTNHQHAITLDLGRTFPTHKYFASQVGKGQIALRNILKAYALLDSEVGYCQGLSFIAALLVMHIDEDDAFECFKYILYDLQLRDQYKPAMAGLHIRLYNLSRLIYDYQRDVYESLDQNEIGPTLYAAPWFLTLFASQFPLGFVVRVLDLLFLDGMEAIYKISLTLIKYFAKTILAAGSFESIIDVLKQNLPSMVQEHFDDILKEAVSLDITNQLKSFEIEYHVLHEEMLSTPALVPSDSADSRISQLESLNQHLKRQNIELVDKLANARSKINELDETIELMKVNELKLISRIQELQEERDSAIQQLVRHSNKGSTDSLDEIGPDSISSEMSNQDSLLELNSKSDNQLPMDDGSVVDDAIE